MKINKKGFTLIELLAVIVILAIIMLIATPAILGVIEDARKGAFRSTAYGLIEAAEHQYSKRLLAGDEVIHYTFTPEGINSDYLLEYKGEKPKNGSITVNNEGKVEIAIHNGTFCAIKTYEDSEVTVEKKDALDCYIDSGLPGPA